MELLCCLLVDAVNGAVVWWQGCAWRLLMSVERKKETKGRAKERQTNEGKALA